MTELILPPHTPIGPGERSFTSGEGPCEATLVIKNPLSAAPSEEIGRSYIQVLFGPPGAHQSTIAGGSCEKPGKPCEAKLVMDLNIEREDGAQCMVGQPCPFYDFWHGGGTWNYGAPIFTGEPIWGGRPPGGHGDWGWGTGPIAPPKPFPISSPPGHPPNGVSDTRARVNLTVACGGAPVKAAFFAVPAGAPAPGVYFAYVEFQLGCTKC